MHIKSVLDKENIMKNNVINYKAFADRINFLIDQAGFSESEVARYLSVTVQAVRKYKAGKSLPDPEHLLDLSELLGVSVDYLLKGDDFSKS